MPTHERIAELLTILEEDARSPRPRFPSQALLALRDDRVIDAIIARLDQGQTLGDVRPLPRHEPSQLLFVCFYFSTSEPLAAWRRALLVVLSGTAGVIGIVDPFEPVRPISPTRVSAVPSSAVPFVVARPSATESARYMPEDLQPGLDRTQAYLAEIGLGGIGGGLGGGVLGQDGTTYTQIYTQTSYLHGGWTPGPFHWVELDYQLDSMADDEIA